MSARGGDDLVGVAYVADRAEAEMIRGLLESAGIPSFAKQVGVDGPRLGFGLLNPGGGQQQVLVQAEQAEAARAVLAEAVGSGEATDWGEGDLPEEGATGRGPRNYDVIGAYARAWGWSLAAVALAFGIFMLLRGG